MSKINVPMVEVSVRRDANTITSVAVPPYELTMLRQMFGKENVNGDKVVGHIEVEADQEYERLSAKYGAQKVVKVYGDDGGERLKEMVEKAAAKPEPAPKKGKAEDTKPE
jgi:hypothetical protein